MDTADPAREYLRLAEHYRQMSDEELQVLVPQDDELTPAAQQALANEVRQRGLKVEIVPGEKPPAPLPFAPPPAFVEHESANLGDSASSERDEADSPYDEDRQLVELCTVWSRRDALKVQTILDVAGIPFFMGPEKATGVDQVTSDFAKGVRVQIMQIGMPWALPPMRDYRPEDDPDFVKGEELDEVPVRCPRCHSTDVVFDGLDSVAGAAADDSPQRFRWTCDSCGEKWEDDGVAKEGK